MRRKRLVLWNKIRRYFCLSWLKPTIWHSGRYRGFLDLSENAILIGWVCDIRRLEQPVCIGIHLDGKKIGVALANEYRQDLVEGGYGHGNHGFRFSIPTEFLDGQTHSVHIKLEGKNNFVKGNLSEPVDVVLPKFPDKGDKIITKDRSLKHAIEDSPRYVRARQTENVQISIIIPTYNRGQILTNTVNSIISHCTDFNFELIIIDDGSTDDTPDRLEKLVRENACISTLKTDNGGPGRARNLGADIARGEILLFMGDDTAPIDSNFLAAHWLAHDYHDEENVAVLGKIRWSDEPLLAPNFIMTHIQGDGQEQFGYGHMRSYAWYGWQFFYSSNVSVKNTLVDNWLENGYSNEFYFAAFEDPEFAYRMEKKYKQFRILYVPAAVLVHDHKYSIESFMRRQDRVGRMAHIFLRLHPEVETQLGLSELRGRLEAGHPDVYDFPLEHYLATFQGLRSWALILDNHYGLGSQNWHSHFLSALFRLTYFEGYLLACREPSYDYPSAYRYVLESFRADIGAALATECLGESAKIGLI